MGKLIDAHFASCPCDIAQNIFHFVIDEETFNLWLRALLSELNVLEYIVGSP